MHHSELEVANERRTPLLWTPTRGNDIPAHAVPFQEGPDGQLYIARGLLWGDVHVGTTSYASTEGAQLYDRYGRSHAVFEYEVLTCASSMRFHLEPSQPITPAVETVRATPQWSGHRDSMQCRLGSSQPVTPAAATSRWSVHGDSVSITNQSPPPQRKTHERLTPFPRPSPPQGQPITTPNETGRKRHQNDPPPYTSPVGGWVDAPKQPSPMALDRREIVQFKHFAQSKCFVLIDDTPSMQNTWSQTRAALAGFVDILSSEATWDGLDVRFLQHAQARRCIKTRGEFESVFNSVPTWRGVKAMTAKVTQVFEESLALIYDTSAPRPVNLLIITDGIATDTQQLLDAMVCFCQKLNGKCVPPHMFRIHILQMGEDRKAVKPLHDFRDRVNQRDRDRRMLSVVSYHRGRGLLNGQSIFKLLLASTCIPENEDPDLGERQPAEAIAAQYGELERIRVAGTKLGPA